MRKLGIIGLGNMGSAILKGIIRKRLYPPESIYISDQAQDRCRIFKKSGIIACSNSELAEIADIIILAVKPQEIKALLLEIRPHLNKSKIIISIAAGIRTLFIEKILNNNIPLIRVMPNLPILVGCGISAISKGRFADKTALKEALKIFSTFGEVIEIKEGDFDVITAISGSGPAYFYFIIDAIIKSGAELGLKKDIAEKLAVNTAFGSLKLLLESNASLEELLKRVASKGGTTEAALKVFKKYGLQRIISKAIISASKRSKELGEVLRSS